MSLEDATILGECLSRICSGRDISLEPSVYETCQKKRTTRVVQRGNIQHCLYHLHDGPEHRKRAVKMKVVPTPAEECLAWRDLEFAPWLLGYEVFKNVEMHWPGEVGKWRVGGRRGRGKFSLNL